MSLFVLQEQHEGLHHFFSFMGVKHGHSHVTVFEPIIKNDQDQDKMTTDDRFVVIFKSEAFLH